MKSLITGANGFVGSYLAKELASKCGVIGLDINQGGNSKYIIDLTDRKKVFSIIEKEKPDVIFHLAAQSSVKVSFNDPRNTMDVNVNGTKNLLDAVKQFCPKSRILIVGSSDIYGVPKKLPIHEGDELKPVSPYGESRLAQEKLVLSYGLNCVITRSFTHTGPGQRPNFVASDLAKQVAEIEKTGDKIIHAGDIGIVRDMTDVRDMVRAYILAIDNCEFNVPYNICSGKSYSIKDILDILSDLSDQELIIVQEKSKLRPNDIPKMLGDNSRFVKATKWKPKYKLKDTLKDLFSYWRERV